MPYLPGKEQLLSYLWMNKKLIW